MLKQIIPPAFHARLSSVRRGVCRRAAAMAATPTSPMSFLSSKQKDKKRSIRKQRCNIERNLLYVDVSSLIKGFSLELASLCLLLNSRTNPAPPAPPPSRGPRPGPEPPGRRCCSSPGARCATFFICILLFRFLLNQMFTLLLNARCAASAGAPAPRRARPRRRRRCGCSPTPAPPAAVTA